MQVQTTGSLSNEVTGEACPNLKGFALQEIFFRSFSVFFVQKNISIQDFWAKFLCEIFAKFFF